MDCAEVRVQIPAEEQLEPLVILEEGDELDDFTHSSTRGKGTLRVKKDEMEDRIKGSVEGRIDAGNDREEGESTRTGISQEEEESEQKEGMEDKIRKGEGATETEVQNGSGIVMQKAGEEMEEPKTDAGSEAAGSAADTQPSVKLRPKDRLSPEDALQKVMFYKKLIMYSKLCSKEHYR